MDDRIWTLLLVGVLSWVIYRIDNVASDYVPVNRTPWLVEMVAFPFVSLALSLLSGGVTFLLWGLVAPELGWPGIDIITAIAITWLSNALIRGLWTSRVRIASDTK